MALFRVTMLDPKGYVSKISYEEYSDFLGTWERNAELDAKDCISTTYLTVDKDIDRRVCYVISYYPDGSRIELHRVKRDSWEYQKYLYKKILESEIEK